MSRRRRSLPSTSHSGGTDVWCESCGKVAQTTRQRAEEVSDRTHQPLYKCPEGLGYHLGHQHHGGDATKRKRSTAFTGSIDELEAWAKSMRETG